MSEQPEALRSALRALLPELSAVELAEARFRALSGGVNRRSFLVSAGGREYVLRLPTAGAEGLLDLATEAVAMRAAAAAGIAPHVIAVATTRGLLLTEFRASAKRWTPAAARKRGNIERLADLLRGLHAIEIDLPVYAAERIARGYLAALAAGAAPELGRFGGVRIQAWTDELLDLARRYDAEHPPTAFCHNDLVAANVLDDGELALVDFEYAVRGSPLLDLAGLAGMNDFGAAQQRELLAAYHRHDAVPRAASIELERGVRMVRLMAFFWARLGERRVTDPTPYSKLGMKLAEQLGTKLK
jgi:aminoglycoside phosphotransferase (APT) family kinase protein